MCASKVKRGKTLVSQAGSEKSISNGVDEEDYDSNDYSEELGDNDSIS